jgi:Flp pilus assembly protein TadB
MSIEGGMAIVLTYLLVSIGVIVAFVGAVFMVGWFIGRQRERRGRRRGEQPSGQRAMS